MVINEHIGVSIIVGVALLYKSFLRHRQLRLVSDTPRSKTASASQGFVEIEGFAWPESTTYKSKDGLEVVYYSFLLQKGVKRGKRTEWETVYSFIHKPFFYLVDATGLVKINPDDASFELQGASTRMWRTIDDKERQRIIEMVGTAPISGFPPTKMVFGILSGNYRVVENEIRVGSPLYVSGDLKSATGEPEKITSAGLSSFSTTVFDTDGRKVKNLNRILDSDGDGKVSASEAANGYSLAAKKARSNFKPENPTEKEFELFGTLRKSENHVLLLADCGEEHLRQRLAMTLWLWFGGGAALVTYGIVAMLEISFLVPDLKGQPAQSRQVASMKKF